MTGQSIEFTASSRDHDAPIEKELETLRVKVGQLTEEVGPFLLSPVLVTNTTYDLKRNDLRSEIDQQAAEISTLQSFTKVPILMQKNSGKPGQEVNCVPSLSLIVD